MSKKILFRASGIGALTTDAKSGSISETQLAKIALAEEKIRKKEKLTKTQREEYLDLKARSKKPFELSGTARSFVRSTWLAREKGYRPLFKAKYLEKGEYNEEEAISTLTEVDGIYYKKNEVRKTKGNVTGECDIFKKINGVKVIQDTKCSWDPETFMNGKMDTLFEWQGRSYMDLWDADEFWLRFVLLDCPPHIYERERWMLRNKFNIMDEEAHPEVKPLFDQLHRNLIYSDNSQYKIEERVKTIKIKRDDLLYKEKLLDRIPHAVEFYKSIKLNQI